MNRLFNTTLLLFGLTLAEPMLAEGADAVYKPEARPPPNFQELVDTVDVVDPIEPEIVDHFPVRGGAIHTDVFVNSQGRAIRYKYEIPQDVNPAEPQPVLIYFHGNNTASQQEIIDSFFPGVAAHAAERGLMPVVVASPETRNPPQEEVRQWYSAQDALLLHEFLRDGLPNHYAVDEQAIYFAGGSQGTCFLHDFMQEYGEHYGGGFYGGCGCYNSPDPFWDPPESFLDNMKVLVNSSTEDFLLEPSHVGYAYYKYTIGLDTRADLDREGGHCSQHWSGLDMALDWFLGIEDIPEEPFEPHWTRVSLQDEIVGLALDSSLDLWMASHDVDSNRTVVMRSSNQGETWEEIGDMSGQPADFGGNGDHLFLINDGELLRSTNDAASFESIEPVSSSASLAVDGLGVLYRSGFGGAYWSENSGDDWQEFEFNGGVRFNDTVAGLKPTRVILTTPQWELNVGSSADGSVISVADTPDGQPVAMTWDSQSLWGIAPIANWRYRLYRSNDEGSSWQAVSLPETVEDGYSWSTTQLTALGPGRILVHGGSRSAWLSEDGGTTWRRIPGLELARNGTVTARGTEIFYTHGQVVFKLRLTETESLIFHDRFQE